MTNEDKRYDAAGREVEYNEKTGTYEPVAEEEKSEAAPQAPQVPVRNEEVKAKDETTKTDDR